MLKPADLLTTFHVVFYSLHVDFSCSVLDCSSAVSFPSFFSYLPQWFLIATSVSLVFLLCPHSFLFSMGVSLHIASGARAGAWGWSNDLQIRLRGSMDRIQSAGCNFNTPALCCLPKFVLLPLQTNFRCFLYYMFGSEDRASVTLHTDVIFQIMLS